MPGAVAFNGERAMAHAKKQIEFGPRPPDTPQLAKTKAYIIGELKTYGLTVTTDEFTASTPEGQKKMTNIIGELPGEILAFHRLCPRLRIVASPIRGFPCLQHFQHVDRRGAILHREIVRREIPRRRLREMFPGAQG